MPNDKVSFEEIGALWLKPKEDYLKNGVFAGGSIGGKEEGRRIILMKNNFKKKPTHPDFYLKEIVPEENGKPKTEAATAVEIDDDIWD